MAKYDPNWLQKARRKAQKPLTHIIDETKKDQPHPPALCGQGWGAKGHPSISTVMYPSLNSLPTCRQCREIFCRSIGVTEFDENGYPK